MGAMIQAQACLPSKVHMTTLLYPLYHVILSHIPDEETKVQSQLTQLRSYSLETVELNSNPDPLIRKLTCFPCTGLFLCTRRTKRLYLTSKFPNSFTLCLTFIMLVILYISLYFFPFGGREPPILLVPRYYSRGMDTGKLLALEIIWSGQIRTQIPI